MSQFTNNATDRVAELTIFMVGLINGERGSDIVKKYQLNINRYIPMDVLQSFDQVFDQESDIEAIKNASNKLFNILYKTLQEYTAIKPKSETLISALIADNLAIADYLKQMRPFIKDLNKEKTPENIQKLLELFGKLMQIDAHYVLKENVLFPAMEQNWKEYACLKLMWSIHDDVRRRIKETIGRIQTKRK